MLDEESKAVQEVAKTTGKAVDAGREIGGFIAQYIGGPLEQAMGIWEDKLKYRRWENQIRLAEKARAVLQARGLDGPTRIVDLSIAIPLLEDASLADSDALQDRWATLLANAADANRPEVRRAYISILAEMTPLDALLLEKVFDAGLSFEPDGIYDNPVVMAGGLPDKTILAKKGDKNEAIIPPPHIVESLVNLARLGVIDSAGAYGGLANMVWVSVTELGRRFVKACRPQPLPCTTD